MNRQIAISALSIVMALGLTVGGTLAYFTDTATSTGNTFSSGELDVSITDQNANTGFINETVKTNWQPGEETFVEFDVRNVGTLPVQLRGFATGNWNDANLDPQNKVKVTRVEHYSGGDWVTLKNDANGITDYFYYTSNGNVGGTYINVAPDTRAQFRLTVVLDETAGNDFQNKVFTSTIQVEARQVDVPWE